MFTDRAQAGRQLAQALTKYKNQNPIIYAIPRGGVAVAAKIAEKLSAPLDLIVVRKVGHPASPEYAVCVVGANHLLVCNEEERARIDPKVLKKAIAKERQEARRRRKLYLAGRRSPTARGKTAILVDDGVATGYTFLTALQELKEKKPAKIIAALPVAPADVINKVASAGAEPVILNAPTDYLGAVGAYYQSFPQLEDEEVIRLLKAHPIK